MNMTTTYKAKQEAIINSFDDETLARMIEVLEATDKSLMGNREKFRLALAKRTLAARLAA